MKRVVVMGSFVADLAFRLGRLPGWGETLMGSSFVLGPGGKGSNQAVAAARAGAAVSFLSKVGRDAFGEMARAMYREEGIDARYVLEADEATGAAAILIDERTGENAIVVLPGACFTLTPEEVEGMREVIGGASVFLTQLELAPPTVVRGLRVAKEMGVRTILNPAPACELPRGIYADCDFVTPNETEVEGLTGVKVTDEASAERAADILLGWGVGTVVVTMGAAGAFVKGQGVKAMVRAFDAGAVVETTGAGDAFNGGMAVGLSEGLGVVEAVRLGCAVAGISVTRPGTAPSMPRRVEVEELMGRGGS